MIGVKAVAAVAITDGGSELSVRILCHNLFERVLDDVKQASQGVKVELIPYSNTLHKMLLQISISVGVKDDF